MYNHYIKTIKEELDTDVKVEKLLGVVDYDYPDFHLTKHCILCSIVSGKLTLLEHEAAKWLSKETLRSVLFSCFQNYLQYEYSVDFVGNILFIFCVRFMKLPTKISLCLVL